MSHRFTISNQSFSIKGQQVSSSVLEKWMPTLETEADTCGDIAVDAFHGWIRHARRYFPRCLARESIACDVDEVLWPDRNRREDAA